MAIFSWNYFDSQTRIPLRLTNNGIILGLLLRIALSLIIILDLAR